MSARCVTAYGLRNRARKAPPTGTHATSVSSIASISTSRSVYTARPRARSPTPSASNAENALGPSWIPAPISPSSLACSSTRTAKPWRARASAAATPPQPPPATRMGEVAAAIAGSLPRHARRVTPDRRSLRQRGHLRRGQRGVEQAHLVDLPGEEVEVGLQAADAQAGRRGPGAHGAGGAGLLRTVDIEHHRAGGGIARHHDVVKPVVVDIAGRHDRHVGIADAERHARADQRYTEIVDNVGDLAIDQALADPPLRTGRSEERRVGK